MRTKCWRPMLLLSWFLVSGTQALWAQDDPAGQYFYQRGTYADPYGVPAYPGMDQAGYPPGVNAWPGTTPYGPAVNQHYVENGFWFNKILSGSAQYYATVEGLLTRTGAPPHALIGAEGVNNYRPVEVTTIDTGAGGDATVILIGGHANGLFFELPLVDDNGTPERIFTGTDTDNIGSNGLTRVFPILTAGELKQQMGAGGARGTWGWWNPDDSGFVVQGFWQDKARSEFFNGQPPILFDFNYNQNVYTRVHPWFGLPLPGDDRDGDGLPGVVVPYDLFVQFNFQSNIFGGNLDWYFTPIYDRDYFKVRPTAGARVLQLNELFTFSAGDSGMGYELEAGSLTLVGGGSGQGQTGSDIETPAVQNLFVSTLDAQFFFPDPIISYLQSRSKGTLAGPEIGLRFDLGGKKFKLWAQSKFGLLAYHSERTLYGYNIGDHYNIVTPLSLNLSNLTPDPIVNGISENPLRAAGIEGSTFSVTERNTTVSPMFEQGIFLQAPIFSYVPILKKMSVLEKAEFQAGYSILVLGNIYRPTNDINWAQFPQFPSLNGTTSNYWSSNWSLGVTWNY